MRRRVRAERARANDLEAEQRTVHTKLKVPRQGQRHPARDPLRAGHAAQDHPRAARPAARQLASTTPPLGRQLRRRRGALPRSGPYDACELCRSTAAPRGVAATVRPSRHAESRRPTPLAGPPAPRVAPHAVGVILQSAPRRPDQPGQGALRSSGRRRLRRSGPLHTGSVAAAVDRPRPHLSGPRTPDARVEDRGTAALDALDGDATVSDGRLRSDDFRLDDAIPFVAAPRGKGGRLAAIPLVEEGLQAARDFMAREAFGAWSCPSANKALARAARLAQRPAFTVYAIRHSFAAGLRRTGADVADIQDLYGHTNPSTTMIYAPPQLVKRQAAIARLRVLESGLTRKRLAVLTVSL